MHDTRTNALLASLPAEDREAVLSRSTLVQFGVNDDIGLPNTEVAYCYFGVEGVISGVAEMADGRSAETHMVGYEGVTNPTAAFVPISGFSHLTGQSRGSALRIEASALRQLVQERPALRDALASYAGGFQRELEQTAGCHALHRSDHRLAKWLLRYHDRWGKDRLDLTQEYLAAMLGSQRTTVNEALGRLADTGALTVGRGRVVIADRAALQAAACECYAQLAPLPLRA